MVIDKAVTYHHSWINVCHKACAYTVSAVVGALAQGFQKRLSTTSLNLLKSNPQIGKLFFFFFNRAVFLCVNSIVVSLTEQTERCKKGSVEEGKQHMCSAESSPVIWQSSIALRHSRNLQKDWSQTRHVVRTEHSPERAENIHKP